MLHFLLKGYKRNTRFFCWAPPLCDLEIFMVSSLGYYKNIDRTSCTGGNDKKSGPAIRSAGKFGIIGNSLLIEWKHLFSRTWVIRKDQHGQADGVIAF